MDTNEPPNPKRGSESTEIFDSSEFEGSSPESTRRSLERLAAHTPIENRYEVEQEIARGGMGAIYSVWDQDLDRRAAMKVALKRVEPVEDMSDSDSRSLGRFLNEARITSQLDHPGIVPVYEIGLDNQDRVFFIMRLVEGVTLLDVVHGVHAQSEDWNLTRALWVVLKVCEAMAYAHSRGIAHRDLKPENIMVGRFGETYVMDWGLAASMEGDREVPVVGTPAYMAPEVARGATELKPQADIYSLGALLYHLVSGRMPYRSDGAKKRPLIDRLLEGPPAPLRQLAPSAPRDLVALCEKAMARLPEDRYESVQAMARDLRAFLEGHVVAAYETGVAAELRKWVVRNRPTAAAVTALVLSGIASVIFIFWFQQSNYVALAAEKARTVIARDEAVSLSYAANLRAAAANLRVFETGEAKRRLSGCTRAHRDWEWAHLSWRADTSSLRLEGHLDGVRTVAFDPSGRWLASGSADTTARIWDAWSGAPRLSLEGHAGKINTLAFTPDGSRLVTGSDDYTVRVWDTTSGEVVHVLQDSDHPVRAVVVEPAGRFAVSGSEDGVLRIWDLVAGDLVRMLGTENDNLPIQSLSISSDGYRVLASRSRDVAMWDIRTGQLLRTYKNPGRIATASFHPDGRSFVAAAQYDMLLLWDLERAEPGRTLEGHSSAIKDVAWSPDGSSLASVGRDNTLRLWQPAADANPSVFLGHDDDVDCVTFSPDGARIASGSSDNSIRIWTTDLRTTGVVRHDGGWARDAVFNDGGTRLASAQYAPSGHQSAITVTDVRSRAAVFEQTVPGRVDCVALSPDGKRLWVGVDGHGLHAWEVDSGLPETPPECDPAAVLLDLDLRGERLMGATRSGHLHWWNTATGELEGTLEAHDDAVTSISLDPAGERAVSVSWDGTTRIWNLATLECERLLGDPGGPIEAVDWGANGFVVTGAADRKLRLWNPETGELVRSFGGHEGALLDVAVHPGGRRVASSSQDKTIRVWDLLSAEPLLTLRDHEDWVTAVAFSPDGQWLASGSHDESIRLWPSVSTDP